MYTHITIYTFVCLYVYISLFSLDIPYTNVTQNVKKQLKTQKILE